MTVAEAQGKHLGSPPVTAVAHKAQAERQNAEL